ncbi:putative uncharacterized protein DDB_G0277255, partial [Musca vetustissima]|uniref:putative uncharacterized protein DDB_G0277255 n=1 Tax=Musca vetustissima TaxID=27455 RepID=UPI002AB669D8
KSLPLYRLQQEQQTNEPRNLQTSYQQLEVNGQIPDENDWDSLGMPFKSQTHTLNNLKIKIMATTTKPVTRTSTTTTATSNIYMNNIEYDLRLRQLMEALVLNSGIENQEDAVQTLLPMDFKDDYRQHLQEMKEEASATATTAATRPMSSTTSTSSNNIRNNNKITRNNIKANYQDNKDLVSTPFSTSYFSSPSAELLSNKQENITAAPAMLLSSSTSLSAATSSSSSSSPSSMSSSASLKDSLLDYVLLEYMTKTKQNLTRIFESNKDATSTDERNSTLTALSNVERIQQQLEFLQKNADKFKKFQQVEQRTKNASAMEGSYAIPSASGGGPEPVVFKEATQDDDKNLKIVNKSHDQTISTNEGDNGMKKNANVEITTKGDKRNTAMNLMGNIENFNSQENVDMKKNVEDTFQDDRINNENNNTNKITEEDMTNHMVNFGIEEIGLNNTKDLNISSLNITTPPDLNSLTFDILPDSPIVSEDVLYLKEIINNLNVTNNTKEPLVASVIDNLKTLIESRGNSPANIEAMADTIDEGATNSPKEENINQFNILSVMNSNLSPTPDAQLSSKSENKTVSNKLIQPTLQLNNSLTTDSSVNNSNISTTANPSSTQLSLENNKLTKLTSDNHRNSPNESEIAETKSEPDNSQYLPYVDEDLLVALINNLTKISTGDSKDNNSTNDDQHSTNDANFTNANFTKETDQSDVVTTINLGTEEITVMTEIPYTEPITTEINPDYTDQPLTVLAITEKATTPTELPKTEEAEDFINTELPTMDIIKNNSTEMPIHEKKILLQSCQLQKLKMNRRSYQ